MKSTFFKHNTSIIDDKVEIGNDTKLWHWTHVCSEAKIGDNCVLGQNVYVGPNVTIGNNVKIQNNVSVYEGVERGDNVFLGPSCVFTNDKYPKAVGEWQISKTTIEDNVSVGANSTILCGVVVGTGSMIGAGSVVTKDVESNVIVVGNPAKVYKNLK